MLKRLTIGCRARIRPGGFSSYVGYEVLLKERSGKDFSAVVLGKGSGIKLSREKPPYEDEVSWINEDDLEFIDDNVKRNIGYIDWLEEHEDDFCPDCGTFNLSIEPEGECKKCGCIWL